MHSRIYSPSVIVRIFSSILNDIHAKNVEKALCLMIAQLISQGTDRREGAHKVHGPLEESCCNKFKPERKKIVRCHN